MTPTLWADLIVIVMMLEVVRIGLTTYVRVRVLDSRSLRRHGEDAGQPGRSLRSAPARARRKALLDPTISVPAVLGIVMGAAFGARTATGIKPRMLTQVVFVVMILLAISLLRQAAGVLG